MERERGDEGREIGRITAPLIGWTGEEIRGAGRNGVKSYCGNFEER